jgi:hypothetical protein
VEAARAARRLEGEAMVTSACAADRRSRPGARAGPRIRRWRVRVRPRPDPEAQRRLDRLDARLLELGRDDALGDSLAAGTERR